MDALSGIGKVVDDWARRVKLQLKLANRSSPVNLCIQQYNALNAEAYCTPGKFFVTFWQPKPII
jgi:hypothetical protein